MGSLKGKMPVTQAELPVPPKTANGAAAPAPIMRADAADLEQHQEPPSRAISAFSSVEGFETAQRMAKSLAASTLVPKDYQNNIPNVLIAMELASRIGASVFMVMQNLDIIHGRPGWRSQFLIGTVNTNGRFTPIRFEWTGARGQKDWACRAVAKDRRTGEECVGAWITWQMVQDEGWLAKSGSKWKTMPEQMFMYRAGAFWTRVYAPEVGLGMQTADEIIDTTGIDATEMPIGMAPGNTKSLEAALLNDRTITADGEVLPTNAAPTASELAADERANATK
jgi:hypothetical protein